MIVEGATNMGDSVCLHSGDDGVWVPKIKKDQVALLAPPLSMR